MSRPENLLYYRLDLQETAASTGYFAAVPQKKTSLLEALAYLRRHPNDSFMHTHLLDVIGEMDLDAVGRLLESEPGSDPRVRTLLFEAALVYEQLSTLKKRFKRPETKALADVTPLVFLRSERLADQTLHREWASLFHANMNRHRPLPPPDKTGLVPPLEGIDGSDTPLTAHPAPRWNKP